MSNYDAPSSAKHEIRRMPTATPLDALHPGDNVMVVSLTDQFQLLGQVEEVAPKLDVVWIRDDRLGERRLFTAADNAFVKDPGP